VSRPRSARRTRASRTHPGLLGTRARKIAAAAGATIAALASLVSVLQFVDDKVSSKETGSVAGAKNAEIRSIELADSSEVLADYVQKVRPTDDRDYTADELARRGYEFLLRIRAKGPPGTHLRLRWMLFDERRGRVRGATYSQVVSDFKTSAPEQAVKWPAWVPYPPREGSYIVRFVLENDEHRPVDQEDSELFEYP
jgi:hypothetical protein